MARTGPRPRFVSRLKIPVSEAMREGFDELAERHDRTLSEEVREAYDRHLADPADPDGDWPALAAPGGEALNVMVRSCVADALVQRAQRHGRTTTAEARIALHRYLVAHDLVPDDEAPTLLTDSA